MAVYYNNEIQEILFFYKPLTNPFNLILNIQQKVYVLSQN